MRLQLGSGKMIAYELSNYTILERKLVSCVAPRSVMASSRRRHFGKKPNDAACLSRERISIFSVTRELHHVGMFGFKRFKSIGCIREWSKSILDHGSFVRATNQFPSQRKKMPKLTLWIPTGGIR